MSSYRLRCAASALSGEPVSSPEAEELVEKALGLLRKAIEVELALEQAETEAEEAAEEAARRENPWELTQGVPGWEDASAQISAAVDAMCFMIGTMSATAEVQGVSLDPVKLAARLWQDGVSPVLQKYSEYGATDSEPVYNTRHALEEAARAVLK